MGWIRTHWPLCVAMALVVGAGAALLTVSLARTGGQVVYALDDPYIHLAVAKNLGVHGVWGVTRQEFASLSSSPLWTLLLGFATWVFGPSAATPLALGGAVAVGLLSAAYAVLRRHGVGQGTTAVALLAVGFLTPLPVLVLTGLEHGLHALLTVAMACAAAEALAEEPEGRERPTAASGVPLLVLAPLVTAARYEGLFLVAVVGLLCLLRRRVGLGVGVVAAGAAPVVAFGLVAVSHGWWFVPNSVLLKGHKPLELSLEGLCAFVVEEGAFARLRASMFLTMLVLVPGLVFLVRRRRSGEAWRAQDVLPAAFVLTALLHLQFAQTGQFYRYEAYLVVFAVVATAVALGGRGEKQEAHAVAQDPGVGSRVPRPASRVPGLLPRVLVGLAVATIVAVPCVQRSVEAFTETPHATSHVYRQQVQMARFLREYYQGQAVAVNDIGAINFAADLVCLDLVGLASMDVARAKRQGRYGPEVMAALAREKGVKVAVVYPWWFDSYGGLPPAWEPVARWRVARHPVWGPAVTFYAVDPAETERLAAYLQDFAPSLPEGVIVEPVAGQE